MKRAQVLTPWVPAGTPLPDGHPRAADALYSGANRPQILDDHPGIIGSPPTGCSDVTGQPVEVLKPDPNLFIVEIVCEDVVLAAIEADSTYLVLWDEDIADA